MKRFTIAFLSGIVFVAMLFFSGNTLKAYATNNLGYKVERLSSSVTYGSTTIPAGSLKVTITFSNNIGYCNAGIRFPYNADVLNVVMDADDDYDSPFVIPGPALGNLSHYETVNENQGEESNISIGTMGMTNSTEDGEMFTFFLTVNDGAFVLDYYEIEDLLSRPVFTLFLDQNNEQVNYTSPQYFEYTVPVTGTHRFNETECACGCGCEGECSCYQHRNHNEHFGHAVDYSTLFRWF